MEIGPQKEEEENASMIKIREACARSCVYNTGGTRVLSFSKRQGCVYSPTTHQEVGERSIFFF